MDIPWITPHDVDKTRISCTFSLLCPAYENSENDFCYDIIERCLWQKKRDDLLLSVRCWCMRSRQGKYWVPQAVLSPKNSLQFSGGCFLHYFTCCKNGSIVNSSHINMADYFHIILHEPLWICISGSSGKYVPFHESHTKREYPCNSAHQKRHNHIHHRMLL